jgi:hypothetical protein
LTRFGSASGRLQCKGMTGMADIGQRREGPEEAHDLGGLLVSGLIARSAVRRIRTRPESRDG